MAGNIVKKNIRKSSESGVAAAIAVVIAKIAVSRNWVPAEVEAYLIVAITGICMGVYDFLRHTDWASVLPKKVK